MIIRGSFGRTGVRGGRVCRYGVFRAVLPERFRRNDLQEEIVLKILDKNEKIICRRMSTNICLFVGM